MKRPPTITELIGNPQPGLDEHYVVKNFMNKTQDEARTMYARGGGEFTTEDFAYMASDGLLYYLQPAFDYLRDDASSFDWDFCHGLLCSLSIQMRDPHLSQSVRRLIKEIATYADTHRKKFNLGEDEDLFNEYVQKISAAS